MVCLAAWLSTSRCSGDAPTAVCSALLLSFGCICTHLTLLVVSHAMQCTGGNAQVLLVLCRCCCSLTCNAATTAAHKIATATATTATAIATPVTEPAVQQELQT
jgi:hypothetical protein